MAKTNKFAPSILAADFTALGNEIHVLEQAGAHMVHFDVMDGHFVPNLSFGIPVLKSIRPASQLPFDVHLMITNPLPYLERYAEAGADSVTVHWEVVDDLPACLKMIRALGATAGFAIKPETAAEDVLPMAELAERILIMSVNPGFGGQPLITKTLRSAEKIANFVQQKGLDTDIAMDGGINLNNIKSVLEAGVNIVVAGSSVFATQPEDTFQRIRAFVDIMSI